ncbi:MAG: MoaD/ThiS family protein [Campylobacteraceae bacterium]
MILVKLFATLRENRGKEVLIPFAEGMDVAFVVSHLLIDPKDVAIILVNGRHQKMETKLADGQKLFLFPPVGGG